MKKLFFYTFVYIVIIAAPGVFAQTDSNSDFNPFPQMEQDQQSVDDGTAAQPQQQSDDWPPANSDSEGNNE